MRAVVVGAGVGGLATAVRLAHAGHSVVVLEQGDSTGGKCGRVVRDGFTWDSGPSLLTMPWVFEELFAATGAPLADELELLRVEPVTEYRFADGSSVAISADLPVALEALEAWSPGSGADWVRFLGLCGSMWRASVPFLTGPPPWPPRRPVAGDPRPDPRDLLAVKPWHTLRTLARGCIRDARLRLVVERFATYAGADPRRAPAALAVAGYVEHAFGAWHPRGGIYELVLALERRLAALGGELRTGVAVEGLDVRDGRIRGVRTGAGPIAADAVVTDVDELTVRQWVQPEERSLRNRAAALAGQTRDRIRPPHGAGSFRINWEHQPERSVSGFALMLGLRGRTPGLPHHTICFPADYDAEFDDVFVHRRPVRDPTLYLSVPQATEGGEDEEWFVLVNAPAGVEHDWTVYEDHVMDRLAARGLDPGDRLAARARRSPADLERETGAVGGAIYGAAPHGRLGTMKRPGTRIRGVEGLWLVGGTVHPGGGLPLVTLGAASVARDIGPA